LVEFFGVPAPSMRARSPRSRLIYTLDGAVRDEKALLRRLKGDRNVSVRPHMGLPLHHACAGRCHAAGDYRHRPLRPARRAGAGANGVPADHFGARKVVRERTKDTWACAQGGAQSGIERAVRRRRCRTFSDGKLYSQIKDRIFTAARC